MKRCAIVVIGLCLLGMAAAGAALLGGCRSHGPSEGPDSIHSQMVGPDLVHAGNRYIFTGVVVAKQDRAADAPPNVMYVCSTSIPFARYDVYLIQGFDQDDAIALKVGRSGGYTYYKYERVYGQDEPAELVYEGSDYRNTGEIVAIEKVGSAAEMSEAFRYLGSVVYQDTTYDVFSMQDVDETQQIAVRVNKAGTTVGFRYYYFKYERR